MMSHRWLFADVNGAKTTMGGSGLNDVFRQTGNWVGQQTLRHVAGCGCLILALLGLPTSASAAVVLQGDRAIDTNTGLVFLNVWEADSLVVQLGQVTGGWRHATDGEVRGLFFDSLGGVPPPAPFNPLVADLILTLGGTVLTPEAGTGYNVDGWYRHTPVPYFSNYDELVVYYTQVPASGLWVLNASESSIGDYTSLPPQFTRPQPFFLVATVPEPSALVLFAVALFLLPGVTSRVALKHRTLRRLHSLVRLRLSAIRCPGFRVDLTSHRFGRCSAFSLRNDSAFYL